MSVKRVVLITAVLGVLCAAGAGFQVKPRTCYEATFRARVAKGPNLDDSPQLVDVMPACVSRSAILGVKFCAVQWKFLDANGKAVPRPHEGASPQTLFFREWRTYRYRFWTPENAVCFELFPMHGTKGNKAEIADVAVREVPDAERGVLNCNGDFSAADDIPWGWQLIGSSLFHNVASGRSTVNTMDAHLNGDLFPVTPGTSVKVEAVCSDPVFFASRRDYTDVRICFYSSYGEASERGKTSRGRFAEPAVSPKGRSAKASHVYRVPAGRHWARVSVWHGIAEKIEVTEVKE